MRNSDDEYIRDNDINEYNSNYQPEYSADTSQQKNKSSGILVWVLSAVWVLFFLSSSMDFIYPWGKKYISLCNDQKQCTESVTAVAATMSNGEDDEEDQEVSLDELLLKYTYNGEEITKKVSEYSDHIYSADDKVEIFVDPDDPRHIYIADEISSQKKSAMTSVGVGLGILVVFVIIPTVIVRKKKKADRI